MHGDIERISQLLASSAVVQNTGREFAVDDHTPPYIALPASIDELARCASAADAAALAVIPVGNGSQLHVGHPPRGYELAVSTRNLTRILAHEAADMTVTVEAGITLAQLNGELAGAGQRLPLDPPHPELATIGAVIATDACGPLRLSHGKVRDVLIGITIVLADGTLTHGGGRVVKNVAGYDLMKLFTGSWGTLGIIVEATFKLQPLPAHEAVFVLPTTGTNAACALAVDILHAPVAPQFVEALNRCGAASVGLDGAAVVVGCGGTREEIAAQQQRLQERLGQGAVRVCNPTEAAQLYARLRDFPARRALALPAHPLGSSQQDCWGCKLSALPSHLAPLLAGIEAEAARQDIELAVLSHVGSGVAFVRCSVPTDENVLLSFAGWLETAARAAGGWAVFDLLPPGVKNRIDPWGTTPPGLTLMRGIKQTLDPNARLSPGRFVGGI